jgi:hypothetical protein
MKNLWQRRPNLLLERRPHHQSDHQQVQDKYRRLAKTVSSEPFASRKKRSPDQGHSHHELHDQVEICPERGAGAKKALH